MATNNTMTAQQAEPLKFLFECQFKDGSIITQTQDDCSQHTPGKNAFYDVLQRIDEVESFGLFSDEDPNMYTVDLVSGAFTVNAVPFAAGDPSLKIPVDAERRLIFFKRHTHHFNGGEETGHDITYYMGWQTTFNGQNVQSTIGIF